MLFIWKKAKNAYNQKTIPPQNHYDISVGVSRPIKVKPTRINKFFVPIGVMKTTKEALLLAGKHGVEGLVFWSGVIKDGDVAYITRAILPSELNASRIHATITQRALLEIHADLKKNNEFLFTQIHSHPGEAFHSETDDENPISFKKGFMSLVVPYFGNVPFDDVSHCEVYEYKNSGIWETLSHNERMNRFTIIK